ncbi:hypothetical protein [Shewanella sp. UCD-KL12]|uniref:hypothetical protein n=1 Tax=Shewanella sp. UCD-KL12 TaxID=1917163 RepID=UPI000970C899|nr:hypothetical protein [Shewanella sp. UCD-KL12]
MNMKSQQNESDPIQEFLSLRTVSELLAPYSFSTFDMVCPNCQQSFEDDMARGNAIKQHKNNEWCLSGLAHCVECNGNTELKLLIVKGKRGHVLFSTFNEVEPDYETPIAISYTSLLKRTKEYIDNNVKRLFKK